MRFIVFALLLGCTRKTAEECELEMECENSITQECAGPLTSVSLLQPSVCDGQTLTSNAPDAGFSWGETTVVYSTEEASCSTQVTIIDTTPPDFTCEPSIHLVRNEASEDLSVPLPEVSDLCDASVSIQHDFDSSLSGSQTTTFTAIDASGNQSSCTSEIHIADLFPAQDLQVLSGVLNEDGQTSIELGWSPIESMDVTDLKLERATIGGEDWTEITTLSFEQYRTSLSLAPGTAWQVRLTSMGDGMEGASSEPIAVYSIQEAGYDVRDVTVPRIPFPTTLYGVVRAPTNLTGAPAPLILLLHGNHGNCRESLDSVDDYCSTNQDHECPWSGWVTTPNAEGMAFQAETLAAQGYIAASISGNAMNCRDDYILERAQLIVAHLRAWHDWQNAGSSPLSDELTQYANLEMVGLIGHSRGGDAVSHVPTLLQNNPEEGVHVESVFSIAPTDFHTAEVLDTHYATLLPACDGDVASLSGREIYDRSVQDGNPVWQAQALYIGANHNFFSTEWAYNDGGWVCRDAEMVGKQAQQGWLEATIGPWFQATLEQGTFRPDILAESGVPPAVESWAGRTLDVRWSFSSDDRLRIDDMEGSDSPNTNLLDEANVFDDFITAQDCYHTNCGSAFDHRKGALVLKWDADSTATAEFGMGGMDILDFNMLSFRIASRHEA